MILRLMLLTVVAAATAPSPVAAAQRNDNSPRTVYGHVVNRDNQPLDKAVVYLKNTKTLAIRSYITKQDGAFHFGAVAAGVDYEVYADYQGGRSNVKTLGAFDERKQVDLTLKIKTVR